MRQKATLDYRTTQSRRIGAAHNGRLPQSAPEPGTLATSVDHRHWTLTTVSCVQPPLVMSRVSDLWCSPSAMQLSGVGTRIVAVVGAGHLAGMRDKWDAEIDLTSICSVPAPPPPSPLLGRWRRTLLVTLGSSGVLFAGVALFRGLHRPVWR